MLKSKTILLIEDETDIALLTRFTLESVGYKVLTAASGQEGLELAENNDTIGLIILDLMMPGMDGYQLIERFKSDPEMKDIPILIFSALVQEKEVEKGYQLGAVGYIKKPFDAERMVREVDRFFGGGNQNTW